MRTLAGAWVRARSIFAHSLTHARVRDLCLCLSHSTHTHTPTHPQTVTRVCVHLRILERTSSSLSVDQI